MSLKVNKSSYKMVIFFVLIVLGIIFLMTQVGLLDVRASGLVEEGINDANLYSRFPIANYQLDYVYDPQGSLAPWGWDASISEGIMNVIYMFTNILWMISCYLSYGTGILLSEGYGLDVISGISTQIGTNIQRIAGINSGGFTSKGFYVDFLLLFILILGAYVMIVGLLKRETTKALSAVINFVVMFIVTATFIAFAPEYITKLNDFSHDISISALEIGNDILSMSQGGDTNDDRSQVDLLRDNLFAIQVYRPWMILQFGTSNIEALPDGEERVNKLLSISPSETGETGVSSLMAAAMLFVSPSEEYRDVVRTLIIPPRTMALVKEVDDYGNYNVSTPLVGARLGTVFLIMIFNAVITIFVGLFLGQMFVSQILFIVYAVFLPISFLLSMLPMHNQLFKKSILNLFNVMLFRAGTILLVTIAFSIFNMLYSLTSIKAYIFVFFIQILGLVIIYLQSRQILSMFALNSSETNMAGRQIQARLRRRNSIASNILPWVAMRKLDRRRENKKAKKAKRAKEKADKLANNSEGVPSSGSRKNTRANTKGSEKANTKANVRANNNHDDAGIGEGNIKVGDTTKDSRGNSKVTKSASKPSRRNEAVVNRRSLRKASEDIAIMPVSKTPKLKKISNLPVSRDKIINKGGSPNRGNVPNKDNINNKGNVPSKDNINNRGNILSKDKNKRANQSKRNEKVGTNQSDYSDQLGGNKVKKNEQYQPTLSKEPRGNQSVDKQGGSQGNKKVNKAPINDVVKGDVMPQKVLYQGSDTRKRSKIGSQDEMIEKPSQKTAHRRQEMRRTLMEDGDDYNETNNDF